MRYYVNNDAQDNGDHEVHTETCSFLPGDRTFLGDFGNCVPAVDAAGGYYTQVNGCAFCSNACHTG